MKISNKLQKWVDQGLISQEQAEKIMASEQVKHSNLAWKLMYWIAGLFIGLGFILLIGANWDDIPAPVKLLGDFAIWAGILYGTYWSVVNKKDKIKELFLTLSFLFVGATIGLIVMQKEPIRTGGRDYEKTYLGIGDCNTRCCVWWQSLVFEST